uniref:RING-type domain-containing protein n=1 Tax=Caenorhabditis tropicalis TaxID=1561998 RepID=A0A1I7TR26_9PELO
MQLRTFGENGTPRSERNPDDYIKLDFFRGNDGKDSGVIYTWTDASSLSDKNPVSGAPHILKCQQDKSLNLFLTFPLDSTSVFVLSDKSFGSYLAMKERKESIPENLIACGINQGHCSSAMSMFKCGHIVCQWCWDQWKTTKQNQCIYCNQECRDEENIRIKLRRGPCPVDLCQPDRETAGVVLIPCGCRIHCQALQDEFEKRKTNLKPLIQKIKYCPYDACKKSVESIKLVRN